MEGMHSFLLLIFMENNYYFFLRTLKLVEFDIDMLMGDMGFFIARKKGLVGRI